MAGTNIGDYLALGSAVAKRLVGLKLPAKLDEYVEGFQTAQGALAKAGKTVDEAERTKVDALEAVHGDDAELDTSLDELASACAGEGVGTRMAPFESFTTTSVSKIKALAYKTEADLVIEILDGIDRRGPAKKLADASASTRKLAKAVLDGLDEYAKAVSEQVQAIARRDALLPNQQKALSSLKTQAKAALEKDKATYAMLFAPPDAIAEPVKKRSATASKVEKKALKTARKTAKSAAKAAAKVEKIAADKKLKQTKKKKA